MRLAGLLAVLAALSLALAGCGPAAPAPADLPPGPSAAGESVPLPIAVSVPSIGAASSLIETGLLADGTPEVPPETDPLQASWAGFTPRPGAVGPAVLYGHVDGQIDGKRGRPGIFHRLRELRPGAQVVVDRLANVPVIFIVDRVETFPKAAFLPAPDGSPSPATLAVYGDTRRPELRLVTCGGEFDHTERTYVDQIVAFAHQQGT